MKPLLLFVPLTLAVLFAACSSSQQSTGISLPALVYQEPLPPFPRPITTPTLRIALQIHVCKDGSVDEVRFLNSSGSTLWDSAAAVSIRLWKYSPARSEGKPINIWLHQTAIVAFSEPQYLLLAEILCSTAEQADSLYTLLEQGIEFSELASKYSIASSHTAQGMLGSVNIQIYPAHIKKALTKLGLGLWTKPIPYGDRYAIFKRLKEQR